MKKQLLFAALVFLVGNLTYAQTCSWSSENCEYYACKEKELQCGAQGYPKFFGEYYCKVYLAYAPQLSPSGQLWLYAARLCLQQKLEQISTITQNCGQIHILAINSHVQCYTQMGYCGLGFWDKLQIKAIAAQEIFRSGHLEEAWSTLVQINQMCEKTTSF